MVRLAGKGNVTLSRCDVDIAATVGRIGTCVFTSGIGQLRGFHASVVVSIDKNDPNLADFDGPYSFGKDDERD
jgi:hypothetical protein